MRSLTLHYILLGVAAVACAVPFVLAATADQTVHHHLTLRTVMHAATGAVMFGALINHKVKLSSPWWLLLLSGALGLWSEVTYLQAGSDEDLYGTALALLSFFVGLIALARLTMQWVSARNSTVLLDTMIMWSAAMVLFVSIADGALRAAETSQQTSEILTLLILDAVYIWLVSWLLSSPASSLPSIGLLLAAQVPLLKLHWVTLANSNDGLQVDDRLWVTWFAFYPLSMLAALHPSVTTSPTKQQRTTFQINAVQGVVLTLCVVAPAVVLATFGIANLPLAWETVSIGSAAITALVVVRVAGVFRAGRAQREELERLAHYDALTGIPNRHTWESQMDRAAVAHAADTQRRWLAIIDIDYFKRYNDTLGHQAGDQFLRDVSAAWRDVVRGDDLLARYGGEEFAIMVEREHADDVNDLLGRLQGVMPNGQTCSIGVASWPKDGSASEALRLADAALYRAKYEGRDQIVWANRDGNLPPDPSTGKLSRCPEATPIGAADPHEPDSGQPHDDDVVNAAQQTAA